MVLCYSNAHSGWFASLKCIPTSPIVNPCQSGTSGAQGLVTWTINGSRDTSFLCDIDRSSGQVLPSLSRIIRNISKKRRHIFFPLRLKDTKYDSRLNLELLCSFFYYYFACVWRGRLFLSLVLLLLLQWAIEIPGGESGSPFH